MDFYETLKDRLMKLAAPRKCASCETDMGNVMNGKGCKTCYRPICNNCKPYRCTPCKDGYTGD